MTVIVHRSFLLGRTMGEAVTEERELVAKELALRGLEHAARATLQSDSFNDYFKMRGAMLAGGLHLVRRRGGRNLSAPIPTHGPAA